MVFPSETETDAALKRLLQAHLPKIAFLQGEAERSVDRLGDRQYKMLTNQITFRNSLVNQGFDVETISLKTRRTYPADLACSRHRGPENTLSIRRSSPGCSDIWRRGATCYWPESRDGNRC